jgi:hypothetical protein
MFYAALLQDHLPKEAAKFADKAEAEWFKRAVKRWRAYKLDPQPEQFGNG